MATSKSNAAPVVGFNHNVSYKGKVFHIQTEDSGLPHAHYITHLFVGGNILASKKTSYEDKVNDADLVKTVRSIMEGQHKDMLRALVGGKYDAFLEEGPGSSYAPGVLADGITGPALLVGGEASGGAPGEKRAPAPPPPARPVAPPVAPPLAPMFAKPPPAPAPFAPPVAPPLAPIVAKPPAPRPVAPPPAARPVPPLTPTPAPFFAAPSTSTRPAPPRGPPPVMRPVAPVIPKTPTAPGGVRPISSAGLRPVAPAPAPKAPAHALPPEVLAARNMTEVPKIVDTSGGNIFFGEDLISDKSLDEVILSYLAADFEDPK